MTDDIRELERRLEQATARRGAAEDPLEPDTAALRAGWLALGELLEYAQPQAALPPQPRPLPPVRRRRRWLPAAMAALAASLLVALAAAWYVQGMNRAAVAPAPSPEIAGRKPEPSASPVPRVPAVSRETQMAWDDSLDQEIDLAQRAVIQVQQDWLAAAAGSRMLQYQLESAQKEIDDSTL